ncbi:MAG TPA: YbjN domain-containing protein [Candidatus Nanopelagicales bacterium]|nr:YbjN domain-containing protein [Candidatus Nanopelagicales bacterium]
MTLEEIKGCLEREGWPVEVLSGATLRSGFEGSARTFHVYVHVEPPFVTFAVLPFARLPPEPEAADSVARKLLRLNREINMAKFSADEDGDILLSVEYRLEDLDPSEVRDAVDVLAFYADRHHADVQRMVAG